MVDRSELPAIAARERVSALLRTHDLVEAERAFDELTTADQPMVRLIARESAAFGTEPAVRYSAIAALAHTASAENLNLLTDLARFGEDFYIRGHAMLALGSAGTYAHLEPILRGLNAEEPFERAAASKALGSLAQHSPAEALRAHAATLGGPELVEQVDAALSALESLASRRSAAPAQTSEGPLRRTAP
jgi:HEAT repeat protein